MKSLQKKIKEWQQNITLQTEQFENKKVSIKDNPGFNIKIYHETVDYGKGYQVILKTEVDNINNIYYLKFIEKYVNSILSIITKNIKLSESDILKKCKSKMLVEIKEDKNMQDVGLKIQDLLDEETGRSDALEIFGSDDEDELIDSDAGLSDFIDSDDDYMSESNEDGSI